MYAVDRFNVFHRVSVSIHLFYKARWSAWLQEDNNFIDDGTLKNQALNQVLVLYLKNDSLERPEKPKSLYRTFYVPILFPIKVSLYTTY